MTDQHILTPDTQAVLLLCGRFNEPREDKTVPPLTQSEYNKLEVWLTGIDMSFGDLLKLDRDDPFWKELIVTGIGSDRMQQLLERGGLLALETERWTNTGIWVTSRCADEYPVRLKERLGGTAPPILYGAGDHTSLKDGGLAIVGSRRADEDSITFAGEVASGCARIGVQVISGGARGVDSAAMSNALDAGGAVVGVLADSLERRSVSGSYRDAIIEGKLVLISPCHPNAGFDPGLAMWRNRLIFTLADRALVVHSDFERGGTWNGARDNLKHAWVPLYVRSGENIPKGIQKLAELGAYRTSENTGKGLIEFPGWRDIPTSKFVGDVNDLKADDAIDKDGNDGQNFIEIGQIRLL